MKEEPKQTLSERMRRMHKPTEKELKYIHAVGFSSYSLCGVLHGSRAKSSSEPVNCPLCLEGLEAKQKSPR